MDEAQPLNLEADPRFPSGPWTGFFLQLALRGRHETNLELVFSNGRLSGEGKDWVGAYTIEGSYDRATGNCEWTKQYFGRHAVIYKGSNNGRGIWGVWELTQLWGLLTDRGGFHIWPQGMDASEESDEAERALFAVMRQQRGSRFVRLAVIAAVLGAATAVAVAAGLAAAGF